MDKYITRKDFLVNTSKAAVGVTAIASLSSLVTTASAETKITAWPWPYVALDPDEARIRGHNLYYSGKACCAGVFGAVLSMLQEKVGEPYTSMPMEIMLFGGGGGAGWGTLCGVLNGGAAMISLVTEASAYTPLVNELFGWYSTELLPTDMANDFAVQGKYLQHKYDGVLPQSMSGSPLCHASVTDWCIVAEKTVGSTERKERCARIAGDAAAKTVEILNAKLAGTFAPVYARDSKSAECLSCHSSMEKWAVMSGMMCAPCHGEPHASTTDTADQLSGIPKGYELNQNYPNPFNPSTNIKFSLPKEGEVYLTIFDIQGATVRTLLNHQNYKAGTYSIKWDGKNNIGQPVASGIYLARILTGEFIRTIKMNLIK